MSRVESLLSERTLLVKFTHKPLDTCNWANKLNKNIKNNRAEQVIKNNNDILEKKVTTYLF